MLAADSYERKELEKKEGKFNPDAWTPENRWRDYCESQEKKEEEEKRKKKDSMFKEYNDMVEEEKKMVSNVV